MNPKAMGALRFAVLRHEGVATPHYDLLIEVSPLQLLRTWQCPHWPVSGKLVVYRQVDHRRIYLDYEGEISGGRGLVRQVVGGPCRILAVTEKQLAVELTIGGIARQFTLIQQDGSQWQLSPSEENS